jgi:endonuclease G
VSSFYVGPEPFKRNPYDRGHLASSSSISICYGEIANKQAFLYSNITLQFDTLNRGVWYSLERKVRDYANKYNEVWVVTGPIFTSDTMYRQVPLPDSFYKIIIKKNGAKIEALAFIIPQEAKRGSPLTSFLVSIDKVESVTDIDFFSELEDAVEDESERGIAKNLWDNAP